MLFGTFILFIWYIYIIRLVQELYWSALRASIGPIKGAFCGIQIINLLCTALAVYYTNEFLVQQRLV